MHTKNKQQIGAFGEQAVADFLIEHNIEVIERNWRVREGCHRLIGERAAEIVTSVADAVEFVGVNQ